MKVILITLFFISTHIFHGYGQDTSRRSVTVMSVDFSLETFFDIQCERFEKSLARSISYNFVRNADSLKILDVFLSKVKFTRTNSGINTRAKFVYSKGADT